MSPNSTIFSDVIPKAGGSFSGAETSYWSGIKLGSCLAVAATAAYAATRLAIQSTNLPADGRSEDDVEVTDSYIDYQKAVVADLNSAASNLNEAWSSLVAAQTASKSATTAQAIEENEARVKKADKAFHNVAQPLKAVGGYAFARSPADLYIKALVLNNEQSPFDDMAAVEEAYRR